MTNTGFIQGRLLHDPVQKFGLANGKPYVQFVLGSESDFRPGGRTMLDCADFLAFNRMGEIILQYLKKGQTVFVEYQLKSIRYNLGEGRKMSVCKPVVTKIRFDHLRDPAVDIPVVGTPEWAQQMYEGFDEGGFYGHGELRELQNPDSEA